MSTLTRRTARLLADTPDYTTDTRVLLTMRWHSTPLWKIRDRKRTSLALERVKLRHECRVNDWAALLRTQGYSVPVGTVLYGEKVTR